MNSETIIGTIAATLTTIAFLPQAIKVIKTKHTKDIALGMYIILITGISLWLVYGILIHRWPIIISNLVTFILASIILVYKLKYK